MGVKKKSGIPGTLRKQTGLISCWLRLLMAYCLTQVRFFNQELKSNSKNSDKEQIPDTLCQRLLNSGIDKVN